MCDSSGSPSSQRSRSKNARAVTRSAPAIDERLHVGLQLARLALRADALREPIELRETGQVGVEDLPGCVTRRQQALLGDVSDQQAQHHHELAEFADVGTLQG